MNAMKYLVFLLISLLIAASTASARVGYYRHADIAGDTIVFVAEEDLWVVSAEGGLARRLTSIDGAEFAPRFSPDGKQVAFTGFYQGNYDVYVMPVEGGTPERLTYHPEFDEVIEWHPDGKHVLFRSYRDSPTGRIPRIWQVPAGGGNSSLFAPYELSRLAFVNGEPHRFFYNQLNRDNRTWKRYAGGTAQDIWKADTKKKTFEKLTSFTGTDAYPMVHEERVWFLSDRKGRMNLFSMTFDGADLRQETKHADWDVRTPAYGDGKIVYTLGADLWVLDCATSESRKLDIRLSTDGRMLLPYFAKPADFLQSADLHKDGKTALLNIRGGLYLAPAKEGRIKKVFTNSGIRIKFPALSPDGKEIACVADATGGDEVTILPAEDHADLKTLSDNGGIYTYWPVWSPDGKHLAYSDRDYHLHIIDKETGKSTKVDEGGLWDIHDYSWSPDGKWLAYSKWEENLFRSIFLYSVEQKKIFRVTDEYTNDADPEWDPEGKYLYFLSERSVNPIFGDFDSNHIAKAMVKPYLVLLQKDARSPFLPKDDSVEEKKDDDKDGEKDGKKENKKKDAKKDDKKEEKKDELPVVKLDVDGIGDRIVPFPVEAGGYYGLTAAKGKIYFVGVTATKFWGLRLGLDDDELPTFGPGGEDDGPQLFGVSLEDKELVSLGSGVEHYVVNGDKMLVKWKGAVLIKDANLTPLSAKDRENAVPLNSISIEVTPQDEWRQMFHDAWRLQRDFYWDPNMSGIDWKAVNDQYEALLPRIGTRGELNDLMGQVAAELGTSHTYVYGGELRRPGNTPIGLLGIDVEPVKDGAAYKITKIYGGDPWSPDVRSPLSYPHVGAKVGEYLVGVNGQAFAPGSNLFSYLVREANSTVELALNSKPSYDGARKVQVETLSEATESELRYNDWVLTNQRYVAEKSSGRIGYVHIPDMGRRGLREFTERFHPQTRKEGLLIDVRSNGGGFVSQMIMERLVRQVWAFMRHRNGYTSTYPRQAPLGRMAVLLDMHAGSDGDIFPRSFQIRELGPVIGTRSWGGVIGIRGDKQLVDSGTTTRPEFAFWEPVTGWGVENHGVDPDIVVELLPGDVLADKDPQLDKGIEYLLEEMKKNPVTLPEAPPRPDKSLDAWIKRFEENADIP